MSGRRRLWQAAPVWLRRLCDDDPRVAAVLLSYTVNSLGSGLWLTGGTVYLVRERHLGPTEVGLGLTLGGVIGVVAGVIVGGISDRVGARRVALLALAVEGLAMVAYLFVSGLWSLVGVASLVAAGLSATNAARGALLAELFDIGEATRLRSLLRAGSNLGIAVGGLGAGVLLGVATPTAFRVLVLADVVTFALAMGALAQLPRPRARVAAAGYDNWQGLRDGRYVSATAVNAVLTMQYGVLSVGIPLWITVHHQVPTFMLAPFIIVNTVLCVLLQVRASRGLEHPARAGAAMARAGAIFLLSCVLIALSGWGSEVVASSVLLVAVVAHSVGELLQAGSSFGASFALTPPGLHGQYQGVWNVGYSLGESTAPIVMSVAVALGFLGWVSLGVVFLVFGLIFRHVINRPA